MTPFPDHAPDGFVDGTERIDGLVEQGGLAERLAAVLAYPTYDYDQPGHSLVVCSCEDGAYIGARKAGTPDCCQRCGFITPAQVAALAAALTPVVQAEVAAAEARAWDVAHRQMCERGDGTCSAHQPVYRLAAPEATS